MYPRASAIPATDVIERAMTHLRNTFVCDPPTEVYLSEPSGGAAPSAEAGKAIVRRQHLVVRGPTHGWRLESRSSQRFREHEPLGADLATQVMRARWINQRPAAIFDVCPHLRRRDLENVRQFVPKEDFFICSQPLANLPELVLSAIICRIDSCWADVSADIARAAVLASALAAPKTESKRARSRAAASRARGVRGGRGRGGGAHASVAGCRAARPALQRGAHLRGDGFCACSAASEPVSSKWARCSAMRTIKRNACHMKSTGGVL